MRLTIKTKTGKIIHKFHIYVPDISKPQKEEREIFFEDFKIQISSQIIRNHERL